MESLIERAERMNIQTIEDLELRGYLFSNVPIAVRRILGDEKNKKRFEVLQAAGIKIIPFSEIVILRKRAKGGFAAVFEGEYGNEKVAIKQINFATFCDLMGFP